MLEIERIGAGDWEVFRDLRLASGGTALSFQTESAYVRPTWPAPATNR